MTSETPADVAEALGDDAWTEITWNGGTKGSLSGEFYRTRVREVKRRVTDWVSDETGWFLLRNEQNDDEDTDLIVITASLYRRDDPRRR